MTKKELETALCTACPKTIADCTDKELYTALLAISQQSAAKKEENAGKNCTISLLNFSSESFFPTT